MILGLIAFSCPLILAAAGALFSEYAGILALFLDGLISFSGFEMFAFTVLTGSPLLGIILGCITTCLIIFIFAVIVEKTHADYFIASLGMNLIFSSAVSLFSSVLFKTRGVLTSPKFVFSVTDVQIFALSLTLVLICTVICFLKYIQKGVYFRITGSDSHVLEVKGVNPGLYRVGAWVISGFFAFFAGCLLSMKISSYVPNLASSKGWMALAAVYLGKRNIVKIVIFVLLFCAGDFLAANIQNYIPAIPSSVLLSFPYIIAVLLSCIK